MVKEFLHEKCAKRSEQVSPIRVYKHPGSLTRNGLAEWFGEWGFTKGAEIGVRAGKFSEVLCKAMPGLNLKCVDPWATGDYRARMIGAERQEEYYQECVRRMSQYPNVEIIRKPSMEAVMDIPDESLDFVYIDGCHEFDYVMTDVIMWGQKVRQDGVIALHDLYHFKRAGVVEAVDVYTRMHRIHEWFMTDERTPTAFWAKDYKW